MSITSKDHGYAALMDRVFKFGHPSIAVGILEKDGAQPKTAGEGEEAEAGLDVITVAGWMEFGVEVLHADGTVEEIPARSFIRAWFDQAEPERRRELVILCQGVVKGTRTKEQILELLGQKCVGEIQLRIARGIPPANKPSTVERKGSSTPLINTGQLRQSVSYAVRENGEAGGASGEGSAA
jgi:hypothetical protein